MDNKEKIEKQIEQKLKENQLDKIDVSKFAKLYKNQITYDFANLYNSFEFNISKEDQEDFNICLNYYLEQENQYFVIKPENTYYYDADISDSLQKVNNAFLKNKLDYIKDIINESILENNYDNTEERNNDVYFKSLLEKYSNNFLELYEKKKEDKSLKTETKFPEKEILEKIERGKKFIDDYYSNRKEKNSMDNIWSINDAMRYVQYELDIKGMKSSSNGTTKRYNIYSKKEREEGKKINERIRNELENYVEKYSKEEHWIYDNGWKIKTDKVHTVEKEHETKKINSNIESTLNNYKEKAIELCTKENPSLKLTLFIKDLVKDLSIEEKKQLFTNTIEHLNEELYKINENTKQESQIKTQKTGRK